MITLFSNIPADTQGPFTTSQCWYQFYCMVKSCIFCILKMLLVNILYNPGVQDNVLDVYVCVSFRVCARILQSVSALCSTICQLSVLSVHCCLFTRVTWNHKLAYLCSDSQACSWAVGKPYVTNHVLLTM